MNKTSAGEEIFYDPLSGPVGLILSIPSLAEMETLWARDAGS